MTHGGDGKYAQNLSRNPERKKLLSNARRRWEDNIKFGRKVLCMNVWIGFSWLRMGFSDRFL